MKIKSIVYNVGGFDNSKPDNNIVETIYYTDEELAQQVKTEALKTALLAKLGITEDEARLLLS